MKAKNLVLVLLLTLPTVCFGQKNESLNNAIGYVNGVELSKVEAKYAQIGLTTGAAIVSGTAGTVIRRYYFDYGQTWKNEREVRITDKKGDILTFQSFGEAMNFFDYNGWELVFFVPDHHQALLKKKGS